MLLVLCFTMLVGLSAMSCILMLNADEKSNAAQQPAENWPQR